MPNPEITNNDPSQLEVFNPNYIDATINFAAADVLAVGTVMGQIVAAAGSVAADGGNTGNGTVTLLALATGGPPKIGDFELECVEEDAGGTGSGVMTADAGNTGNGTAGAVTVGDQAIEGDYIITCTDATVSGSEVFSVVDPNGNQLEDLTVGVAYLNEHFGVTISDGAVDFIVGDFWTNAITLAHGGRFKLTDPDGVVLKTDIQLPGTAAGTVAVVCGGISFTLTDGSTDFALGDLFTLTIDAGSYKWKPYVEGANDGTGEASGLLPSEVTATASGDLYRRMLIEGEVKKDKVVVDGGGTLTDAMIKQLREKGMILLPSVEMRELDNQ
jgi:hypothetical protein